VIFPQRDLYAEPPFEAIERRFLFVPERLSLPLPVPTCYPQVVFKERSPVLERIDTGDYTPEEYETFLREIAFINRHLGDGRALGKSLLREIEREGLNEFSVLDVGSGSGELLRMIAEFARRTGRNAKLTGLDLNPISAAATRSAASRFPEISSVRGDAFELPFTDGSFDYAISSLFFHHLTDRQIPYVLREMSRVASRGFFIIDLHRHPAAYVLYQIFCLAFRISPLVRQDGSLSVLRGFKPEEVVEFVRASGLRLRTAERAAPFRIVVSGESP